MRSKLVLFSAVSLLMACASPPQTDHSATPKNTPKNIIFMIGDGMGPSYLTAYRYYVAEGSHNHIEPTIYDHLWRGMSSTWPEDQTLVTDSAAAATALATGFKSFNGAISVDQQHLPIGTMMQQAKRLGKTNGIVASSQINHATPAAFLAHNPSRRNMDAIADSYVDYRINGRPIADVMLGGGRRHFIRNDRDLIAELRQLDYQYAASWEDLSQLNRMPAIALLAERGLPSVLDQSMESPLQQLTNKALKLLAPSPQGFVLMVEGSQIDWCGHANDIACAMAEMHDFALAIETAKAFVDANPDTLLIVTADHETGGLSLGANGVYEWRADLIYGIKYTVRKLTEHLMTLSAEDVAAHWLTYTGLPLSDVQLSTIVASQHEKDDLYTTINQLINTATRTGWTTTGHTAADVPVLAYGASAEQFNGFMDNSEIAQRIMQMLTMSSSR